MFRFLLQFFNYFHRKIYLIIYKYSLVRVLINNIQFLYDILQNIRHFVNGLTDKTVFVVFKTFFFVIYWLLASI